MEHDVNNYFGGQVSYVDNNYTGEQVSYVDNNYIGGQVSYVDNNYTGGQVSYVDNYFFGTYENVNNIYLNVQPTLPTGLDEPYEQPHYLNVQPTLPTGLDEPHESQEIKPQPYLQEINQQFYNELLPPYQQEMIYPPLFPYDEHGLQINPTSYFYETVLRQDCFLEH